MLKSGTHSLFHALFCGTFALFSVTLAANPLRIKSLGEDELTATILQITEDPLIAGQVVCIMNRGQEINCGKVFRSNETEAIALFSEEGEKPLVGDEVIARKQPGFAGKKQAARKPAAKGDSPTEPSESSNLEPAAPPTTPLLETEPETSFTESEMGEGNDSQRDEETPSGKPKKPAPEMATTQEDADRQKLIKYHRNLIRKFYGNEDYKRRNKKVANLSAGISFFGESTGNNIWPMGLLQFAVGKSSIFGLHGGYSTFGGSSVSGTTYYLTVNYHYYPHDAFEGPTGRVGLGTGALDYNAITNNRATSGKTTPFVFIATTGYRWPIESAFNIGVEAGVQVFQFSISSFFNNSGTNTATSSSITFLMPLLLIDFGISF